MKVDIWLGKIGEQKQDFSLGTNLRYYLETRFICN